MGRNLGAVVVSIQKFRRSVLEVDTFGKFLEGRRAAAQELISVEPSCVPLQRRGVLMFWTCTSARVACSVSYKLEFRTL